MSGAIAEWVIAILIIPGLVMLVRITRKWAQIEDKQNQLIEAIEKLVEDKDKVHSELYNMMREDRDATNTRLTYLERIWIERGPKRR